MNCLLLNIVRSAYNAVGNDTCMKQMLIRYPYLQAQITAMGESVPVLHTETRHWEAMEARWRCYPAG